MFRIELYCEDRNLSRVLVALTGLIANNPVVQPVINAAMQKGRIQSRTNGSLVELFDTWIKTKDLKKVGPIQIREFCRDIGRSEKAYSGTLIRLIKNKKLRRQGKEYVVL